MGRRPTVVVVVSGRHRPHEILLLAVSVLVGAAYTFGAPPPTSLAASMPHWAVRVWATGLALSGVVGLVGVAGRSTWALQVEQAAMLIGAAALVWYTAALAPLGWRALFAEAVFGAWAVANLVRARQIRQDLGAAR
jgi:hypothetical protein